MGDRRRRLDHGPLSVVPQFDLKVVESTDGAERVVKMMTTTAVVAQDTPILEAGDRMLDTGSALAMNAPRPIADDSPLVKARRSELRNTAIAAVSENSPVSSAARLDDGSAVVHRIVAVAGPARCRRHDHQVTAANQDLCIA